MSTRSISSTLYDAFGQRQVSTIYNALNQYHVVMEVAPEYWDNPERLKDIYVSTTGGAISGAQATGAIVATTPLARGRRRPDRAAVRNQRTNAIAVSGRGSASTGAAVSTTAETMIPLSQLTKYEFGTTPLAVNHQGLFVASIDLLQPGARQDAQRRRRLRERTMHDIGVPATIHGSFQGTARRLPASLLTASILVVLAALAAIYIVLGMLYESYIHPITILSTLPSAGIGALLALKIANVEFSLDRHDRRAAAGRHREEERHHDDRRGARPRARAKAWIRCRGDPPGAPAALPSHPDDDHGRDPGRPAARASASATAPSCASRSESRSSAACSSARSSRSIRRR